MKKAEIALVIRMQLNQLHTSDPLADDFYSQVFNARQGCVNEEGGIEYTAALWNLFRHRNNQPRHPDGTPKLSSTTLGRIAATSLRKPKKLMDMSTSTGEAGAEEGQEGQEGRAAAAGRRGMFAGHNLGYLIEEGIRGVMDVEDCDSLLAAVPPEACEPPAQAAERQHLQQQRDNLVLRLAEALDLVEGQPPNANHPILAFVEKTKGRLLLYRALLLMTPPHTHQLCEVLLFDLGRLIDPALATAKDARLGMALSQQLRTMPLPRLNEVFLTVVSNGNTAIIADIVRSKIGCTVLLSILKVAHKASAEGHMPAEGDFLSTWREIFNYMTGLLGGSIAFLFDSEGADGATRATKASMWELMAAVMAHADPAARAALGQELVPVSKQELGRVLQAAEEARDKGEALPTIGPALAFIFTALEVPEYQLALRVLDSA